MLPHDVVDIAADVLAHRLVLSFDAVAEGVDPRSVVGDASSTPVPRPRVAAGRPERRGRGVTVELDCRVRASFRGLDLTVRRRLDGLLHGDHAGLRLGPGSDAEELTRYQPGHDVRRIDWNVTARAREPHVWLTRAEHELDTWLLLDQTPSMAFGTATAEKADLAATVAGAVGLLTDAPGNRLGVGTLSTRRPDLGPTAAPAGSPPTGAAAAGARRRGTGWPRLGLAEALTALARRHRRPGLRVDRVRPARPGGRDRAALRLGGRRCAGSPPDTTWSWSRCSTRASSSCRAVGQLVLVDPESGRQREVDTGDRRVRDRVRGGRRRPTAPPRRRPSGRRGRPPPAAHRPRLGRRAGPIRPRASPTPGARAVLSRSNR